CVVLDHVAAAQRGRVLVIDSGHGRDVRGVVEQVQAQAAHAVVLVFTAAENEKQVGAAVKGSSVFAVLPIPLDKPKTGAVFEGALADAVTRKSTRGHDRSTGASSVPAGNGGISSPAVSVQPLLPHTDSGAPSASESKNKIGLFVGVGVAVAAVAVGAFMFIGKKEPATPSAATPKVANGPAKPVSGAPAADAATLASPAVQTPL